MAVPNRLRLASRPASLWPVVNEPQTIGEGPSTPLPTLVVDHLHKRYRDLVAVADITFQVLPGQIYGLLGPNGAGKSTTIHCITGVVTPTQGSIFIRGHRADSVEAKNMLGFVPDDLPLPEALTGREYLRFVSRIYERENWQRLEALAELLGIRDALNRLIREYSHGMHKKLQIAAALAHDPPCLILDEPFRGLDPEALMILREVLDSRRRRGLSALVATHELTAAATMCDKVGIVANGELKIEGAPNALREQYDGRPLEDIYLEVSGLLARRGQVREMLDDLEN
jgi:ABC-2 type transport system ATP-binding protein